MRLLNLKKSRKQINKIVLRFFAFVSIISVTLSVFCIGGNAISNVFPSVNVSSAIAAAKADHGYIEFKNNSLSTVYNTSGSSHNVYYNTVILFFPKWISSLLPNQRDYSGTKPQTYSEYFGSHVSAIKSDSEVLGNLSYPYKVLSLYLYGLNDFLQYSRSTESFYMNTCYLYYDGTDYYAESSITPSTTSGQLLYATVNYSSAGNGYFYSNWTNQGFGFPTNYNYFQNSAHPPVGVVFQTSGVTNSQDMTNMERAYIVLGDIVNYAWDVSNITVDFSGSLSVIFVTITPA